MKVQTSSASHELNSLAADAEALLAVTADAVEDNVLEARKRLMTILQQGRNGLKNGRDCSIAGADESIRGRLCQSIGVAFGLGALLSFLITRRG